MSKPLALLYFTRDKTEVANDIAVRIRNEGNVVNLVYAGGFRGPEQCIKADAIIIQKSFGRSAMIVETYQDLWPQAEIHLYNDDGEFDDEAFAATQPDPSTEEEPSDPEPTEEVATDDPEPAEGDDNGETPTVTE